MTEVGIGVIGALTDIADVAATYLGGVIVKSGVQAVESSGDLIDPCHLDTIFKFNSSNHLGQVVEST